MRLEADSRCFYEGFAETAGESLMAVPKRGDAEPQGLCRVRHPHGHPVPGPLECWTTTRRCASERGRREGVQPKRIRESSVAGAVFCLSFKTLRPSFPALR